MSAIAELAGVTLDCPSPRELAEFYHRLTGWEITHSEEQYAALGGPIPVLLQGVADHRAPRWPDADAPQQFHLDFYVEDLDKAEARALELGAGKPAFQPGEDRWHVLTDPAGHPFCLCVRST